MNGFAEAFAEPEAKYKAQVMHATRHKGWFTFTIAYGGVYAILDSDWGKQDDAPGLYAAMMDYMDRYAERGVVMRLEGEVIRYKSGKYRIIGKRYIVKVGPKANRQKS